MKRWRAFPKRDFLHKSDEKWPKILDFALWVGYINGKEKPGEGLAVKQRSSRMPKSEFMKIGCFFAAVSVCIALIACGESSDYGSNVKSSITIYQGQDFPACGRTNENQILYVHCKDRESLAVYKCTYDAPFWDWYIDHTTRSVNLPCPVSGVKSGDSQKIKSSSSTTAKYTMESMTDARDGQTYEIVTIGSQVWMAENLNFETANSYGGCSIGYNCIEYVGCSMDTSCTKFGRLYTWSAAMDSTGTWSTNGKDCGSGKTCSPTYPVRGICPSGWHLPTEAEWNTLFTAVGGITADEKLKSSRGWNSGGNGTNAYGFDARPVGYYMGSVVGRGLWAYFWSSTDRGDSNAVYAGGLEISSFVGIGGFLKRDGFSVRCIQDSTSEEKSSSSESLKSSSSQKIESSSSSNVVEAANDTMKFMTDSRDGQKYKIVKIGNQVWMAENLNFKTGSSFCFNDYVSNCTKYGRLYTWAAAMDSARTWSTNGKGCGYNKTCSPIYPVRGVCPEGWHLPSQTEWNTLFTAVGGSSVAGTKLKSTSGWDSGGNGTDAFGFSALSASYRNDYHGYYGSAGHDAFFWSSREYNSSNAYRILLYNNYDNAYLGYDEKYYGASVRCIQDDSMSEEKSSSSESLKSSSSLIIESSSSSNSSSSSSARLSSGMAQSSSSTNAGFVGGTLVDSRDGQTYRTVVIGSQTWMAENLNFKTDSSFCNNNSADNCEKYGRLYIWGNAKSACPSGWHLPSNEEWGALFTAVGGQSIAGSRLKFSSGWNEYKGKSGNGSDSFGFSSLPAGYRNNNGNYYAEGSRANFWSSSEIFGDEAYNMCLHYDDDNADLVNYDKGYGVSVRCLKD